MSEITNSLFLCGPSSWVKNSSCTRRFYATHPNTTKGGVAILAIVSGILNVVLFPVKAVAGTVVFPFMALYRVHRGETCLPCLKAWAFCLLSTGAVFAFFALAAFTFPFALTLALFAMAIAVSVIFHVHDACSEPVTPLA